MPLVLLKRSIPVCAVGRCAVVPVGITIASVVDTLNILPSKVKLLSSSSSPFVPATTILLSVRSLTAILGTTKLLLNVIVIAPVVVSTTNMSLLASSLTLSASARLVGTTISFSPVAPLKFILSVRYKSFQDLVALPKS